MMPILFSRIGIILSEHNTRLLAIPATSDGILLNMALSDYPFDYLQLHIVQVNLSDFSKDEMVILINKFLFI